MSAEVFGPFRLIEEIAVGGMGQVLLARREGAAGFAKAVVVKRLREDLASDPAFVDMFLDEGRLAARLDHPNIVPIYELGEVDGQYFMAMEYVAGTDLRQLLKAVGGKLELPEVLQIMRSVCEGLAFAHDACANDGRPMQLVHRDINPQNILISAAGAVKIADFGIAKVAQRHNRTQAGFLKGKFGYLSPEQARAQPLDRRCDIYALGLVLFELTVGRSAIPSGSDSEMLAAAANGMLIQPQELDAGYPEALAAIYRKATAWRPSDRYQTVPQMQEDLLEFQMDRRLLTTPQRLAELVEQHFSHSIERQRRALDPNSLDDDGGSFSGPMDELTRLGRHSPNSAKRKSVRRSSEATPGYAASDAPAARATPMSAAARLPTYELGDDNSSPTAGDWQPGGDSWQPSGESWPGPGSSKQPLVQQTHQEHADSDLADSARRWSDHQNPASWEDDSLTQHRWSPKTAGEGPAESRGGLGYANTVALVGEEICTSPGGPNVTHRQASAPGPTDEFSVGPRTGPHTGPPMSYSRPSGSSAGLVDYPTLVERSALENSTLEPTLSGEQTVLHRPDRTSARPLPGSSGPLDSYFSDAGGTDAATTIFRYDAHESNAEAVTPWNAAPQHPSIDIPVDQALPLDVPPPVPAPLARGPRPSTRPQAHAAPQRPGVATPHEASTFPPDEARRVETARQRRRTRRRPRWLRPVLVIAIIVVAALAGHLYKRHRQASKPQPSQHSGPSPAPTAP